MLGLYQHMVNIYYSDNIICHTGEYLLYIFNVVYYLYQLQIEVRVYILAYVYII